ncbi:lysophospholipid acyltransferase family protein [Gorillibacterium sp. sgz5001074]|uniref:lysophospholipid acyltransferase family protein n=1 Tax=Gorillibacterium sp. sgz5001074 TaxID=3446695 RepID=UPI003F66FF14
MYAGIGKLTGAGPWGRIGRWAARSLPEAVLYTGLELAGFLLRLAVPRLHRRILTNMGVVLLEQGLRHADLKRMARSYWTQLTVAMFELLCMADELPAHGMRRIAVNGEEHLDEALEEGKGAIIYAPHTGNFFFTYWRLSQSYDCLAVATAGSAELRPLYLRFQQLGCKGLDYDATPPLELLRRLKSHLAGGGVIFLLGDFYRPTFPVSRLFGRLTRSPSGAAQLSLEHGVPVVPCCSFREGRFRHRVELGRPIRLYEAYGRKERTKAAEELNRVLEQGILRHPEQWFYWFQSHERWLAESAGASKESLVR